MSSPAIDHLPRESQLPDADLVDQVRAGQTASFAVLMRRYNQRAFRVARGILGNDAEAEDACQEAFVKAYQKLDQLAEPAAFGGWVARIAANDALRRRRRHKTLMALIERGEIKPMHEDRSQPTPEDSTQSRELRHVLEAAIDELPAIYRAVLVMRDIEGMLTEEAAAALEIEPGTVRVRLHRARRLMREQLDRRLDLAAVDAFSFDGARCDRTVAEVFRRIGDSSPD